MLIVDDILLLPARSIMFVFRQIHDAAQQEFENEAQAIQAELRDLYMMLETGRITEEDFDIREDELLDRLEEVQSHETYAEAPSETPLR